MTIHSKYLWVKYIGRIPNLRMTGFAPSDSLLKSAVKHRFAPSDSLLKSAVKHRFAPSDSLLKSAVKHRFAPSDSLLKSAILSLVLFTSVKHECTKLFFKIIVSFITGFVVIIKMKSTANFLFGTTILCFKNRTERKSCKIHETKTLSI